MNGVYHAQMSKTKAKLVSPAALTKPVWTFRRQLLGNLIPLILPGPIGLVGIGLVLARPASFWLGIGLILLACVSGWFSLSYCGLFENQKMKLEMTWRFRHAKLPAAQRRYFVGVASPGYRGVLDPHEDVGFLLIYPDRLEFFGEKASFQLPRDAMSQISRKVNIHSFVFLGGWIAVRGVLNGKEVELRIEPRIYQSMWSNRRAAAKIMKRLNSWREGAG